ncbi:MAG: hypothetical protein HY805_05620 [Nitrospirae bacterium]|nr:hypothetical protein [Nitrospirota bacterium]
MRSLVILFFLISLNNAPAYDWHTTPDKWTGPRIFHSEFYNNYESRIQISHTNIDEKILREKERNYSPNGAYWFVVYSPDIMEPGPWSTEIRVFNERDYIIKIELIDHAATYTTTIKWINEKLIYIELWWGRVLGTYFIFDVEKEKVVIREMVHDGGIAFQQWQQNKQR